MNSIVFGTLLAFTLTNLNHAYASKPSTDRGMSRLAELEKPQKEDKKAKKAFIAKHVENNPSNASSRVKQKEA